MGELEDSERKMNLTGDLVPLRTRKEDITQRLKKKEG